MMDNSLLSFLRRRVGSPDALKILVRGAGTVLLVQGIGNAIGYIGQILMARWLGVAEYGDYTFLVTWAQVLSIVAMMGLDFAIVRFIPEYSELHGWGHLRGILAWSRRLVLGVGAALAVLSATVLLAARPVHAETAAVLLGSLLILLFAFSEIQTQMIRCTRRMAWAYGPPIVLLPLLLVGFAYAFLRGRGELTDGRALAAMALALGLIIAVQFVVIHRSFASSIRDHPAAFDGRRWISVSLPLLFNSIFSVIVLRVDTLVVGFFLGSEEVGIYGAAVKTATMVGIAFLAANTIVGPMIAAHYARRDMAALQNFVSLATLGSFAASLVIGAAMALFHRPLLATFGPAFSQAALPLLILIAGQLVNVGAGSVGLLMVLTGHERQSMLVLGACALITSGLCFLLIPLFGIVGAAAASSLGLSIWNIWTHRLVVRQLRIRPSIFFAVETILLGRKTRA